MRSDKYKALDIHDHVVSKINESPLILDPFPHCYIKNIFPENFYLSLLSNLPEDDEYERYPEPYSERLYLTLDSAKSKRLGSFWSNFESWINGQDFLLAMAEKFSDELSSVSQLRENLINKSSDQNGVTIGTRTILTRDYKGFSLGPHTDSIAKFIVGIFYLPNDMRFKDFGTSIYRPKNPDLRSWDSPHYSHKDFRVVRTFENVPNSLFMFMKTDNSFHGVEPGDYSDGGRNMMMWLPQIGFSSMTTGQSLVLPRRYF